MKDWLKFPPDWPSMEDEGRLVDAVVDEGDVFALITGRLEFVEMMEGDDDDTAEVALPLFNIIVANGNAYSFHEVVEFRFVEIGTIN